MPRIYTSQVSANSGRSNSPLQGGVRDDTAFGGGIGRATEMLSNSIGRAADLETDIRVKAQEKRRREEEANKVALFDTTEKQLELRNEVGPDGEGYSTRVREMYINEVDEYTSGIEDDTVRTSVRTTLMGRLPSVSSSAAQYEFGIDAEYSQDQANASLDTLQNRIMMDPYSYDQYLTDGESVIDAKTDIPASLKEGMKLTWRQNSAKRHFEGRLQNAKTRREIDAIADELAGNVPESKDWATEFLPADYDSMMNTLGNRRKQFVTAAEANARSILSTFEERMKTESTQLIPVQEMTAAQETIKEVEDPELRRRMARIMRDQDLVRQTRGLPPAEIRAQINQANGNPNVAYPGLPPVVSGAINEAAETFGVSASYLGATTMREYGQFFKKPKINAKEKYKPRVVGSSTVMSDLPYDVVNAVTQAGQVLDRPLDITDTRGKALDGVTLSTLGMGDEDKIRLVSSLVDAGFTGFEEYDDALHVSMQAQVPQTFGEKDGKFWGGWTNLSPTIATTLQEKGFEPGTASDGIKRAAPIESENAIDFGKPTQITDETGKPTSSAVGVMQFTDGTFLNVMKDGDVAAAIGIDVSGMSDADILALRSDPRVSVMAGAALALKNRKQMESTLGRQVNEAEMYMAHFLGAPKATGLIIANKSMPNQSAAKLFPDAAKANKNVFYDGNRQKSVAEVYDDISGFFTMSPTQVAYDDNQTRKRLLERSEQELKNDPISHAASVGSHTVSAIDDEGGFRTRSTQAKAIADYYRIPVEDMKPFTQDEAQFLSKRFAEGTVDENLQILSEVSSMGPGMSKAALNQIAEYDPLFAHAGSLYSDGNTGIAADILRGRQRVKDNPNIITQIGRTEQELADGFVSATDGALFDIPPENRQAIQDAAFSYYLQHMSKAGDLKWRNNDYKMAVQAVMGGSKNAPAIDTINGQSTVMPKGVTADLLETAIGRMGVEDWTAMSMSGKPPRYGDGVVINPNDIRDEVAMRYIGGNAYTVMLDDGTFLITDEITPDGRPVPYVFQPDPNKIKFIANRPIATAQR